MNVFWKVTAGILLTVILGLALGKQERDITAVLTMTVCCMAVAVAASYLKPILDFLWKLQSVADLQNEMLSILLKAAGIGAVAEVAGMICSDSGNASLGRVLQILSSVIILHLAIPIFRTLLELIQEILLTI